MTLYPVFLDLAGLPVVVVGGGTVAAGKLDGLVAAGARVTVIAPAIGDAIRARDVAVVARPFEPADLDGARYVVAAATALVNAAVARAASARGLFVNAVDDVASATAFLGGVVRRGDVTVAISTRGVAPALAGLLREALDAVLPDDLERWVAVAMAARADWKRAGVPIVERRPLLFRALARIYPPASEASTSVPPSAFRGDRSGEPSFEPGRPASEASTSVQPSASRGDRSGEPSFEPGSP